MQMFKLIVKSIFLIALTSPTSWATCTDCSTLEFGKKAQLKKVLPLLTGDLKSKTDYIQNLGVDLFRVPTKEETPTLGFLKTPPKILMDFFGAYFADNVVGLYLTDRSYSNKVIKPTILLIESADSWTISHEFMHYLFDRARLQDDPTSESKIVVNMNDAKEDFMNSWTKYKMNNMYLDQTHKEETIQNFAIFSEVQQHLLNSFEVEEMVIEKQLRSLFVHHKNNDLDKQSFERSTRYINSTGSKALTILNVALETCQDLRTTLVDEDQELISILQKPCAKATATKKEILRLGQELGISFKTQ
ncbi:MAG: hypothetical protein HUU57_07660 [Bdellovibrio sp.]|nr:hypothetical protein [Bdellovibrio sp.]